ncbi:unnamed protein product, partial [Ectocarpus fasciculatus]
GYDGGDCCECTCEPRLLEDTYGTYRMGCDSNFGFACIDPDAPCVDDDYVTVGTPARCDIIAMGNTRCDDANNNEECAYDGGDCCPCTCEDGHDYKCGQDVGFACIDPAAACFDESITA